MTDLLLGRRQRPWMANVGKRVVRCDSVRPYYFGTPRGAEIDLILEFSLTEKWAIEIKRSSAPSLSKGFYEACADVKPERKYVVYAGTDTISMGDDGMAISLTGLMSELVKRNIPPSAR